MALDHRRPEDVIEPLLVALIAYGVLVRVVTVYGLCTLRFPTPAEAQAYAVAFDRALVIGTLVHAGFALLLASRLRAAWLAPPSYRAGRLVGLLLGLVYVAGAQLALVRGVTVWRGLCGG